MLQQCISNENLTMDKASYPPLPQIWIEVHPITKQFIKFIDKTLCRITYFMAIDILSLLLHG